MINYAISHTKTFLILSISFLIFQKLTAQNSKCPPVVIPSVSYQYQGQLKSAFGAEVNFQFVRKKCDCSSTLGALCYLWGPTAIIKSQYYPDIKAFDIAGSFGYRFILLKPEITGGYTFVKENYGQNFFHIDPAIGVDLFAGNISFGYSFRTIKIENKVGSFYFRIAVSPFVLLSKNSKARNTLSKYSKTSKEQIRSFRSSF
jgi:hypothetical protein